MCVRKTDKRRWERTHSCTQEGAKARSLSEPAEGEGCGASSQRTWPKPLRVMLAPVSGSLTLLILWEEECCSNLIRNQGSKWRSSPTCSAGWKDATGMSHRSSRFTGEERGTDSGCPSGELPLYPKGMWTLENGSKKSGQSPKLIVAELGRLGKHVGKFRTKAILCHGAGDTWFPGAVVNSSAFSLPEVSWFVQ